MIKPVVALLLSLSLMFSVCAQEQTTSTIPAPPTSQVTSFESLIKAIQDLKSEVADSRKENAETKAQIPAILDMQYAKLLSLLLIWTVIWEIISKLLGRVWDWLISIRFRRATEDHRDRILREQKEILARLEAIDALARKISVEVKDIKPQPLSPAVEKKRSLLDRILQRNTE